MAKSWFVRIGDNKSGPFSPEQMVSLAKKGKIDRRTHVRREDQKTWVHAARVQGLFPDGETATKAPTSPPHLQPKFSEESVQDSSGRPVPAQEESNWGNEFPDGSIIESSRTGNISAAPEELIRAQPVVADARESSTQRSAAFFSRDTLTSIRGRRSIFAIITFAVVAVGSYLIWASPSQSVQKEITTIDSDGKEHKSTITVNYKDEMRQILAELKSETETCFKLCSGIADTWHKAIFRDKRDFSLAVSIFLLEHDNEIQELNSHAEQLKASLTALAEIPGPDRELYKELTDVYGIYADFRESASSPEGNYRTYVDETKEQRSDIIRRIASLEVRLGSALQD